MTENTQEGTATTGRVFKVLIWVSGYLLLLLATVGVILLLLIALVINPQLYKEQLSSAIYSATGHRLVIAGNIETHLIPHPGFSVNRVHLHDPEMADERPIFWAESARMNWNLWALLQGEMKLADMRFSNPRIHLEINENGEENWIQLKKGLKDSLHQESLSLENRLMLLLLSAGINNIVIENASVAYQDNLSGLRIQLEQLDLTLSNSWEAYAGKIQLQTMISSNRFPESIQAELNALLLPKTQDKVLEAYNLDLKLHRNDVALKITTPRMRFDLLEQKIKAANLELRASHQANQYLFLISKSVYAYARQQWEVEQLKASFLVDDLPAKGEIAFASLDQNQGILEIDDVTGRFAEGKFELDLLVSDLYRNPQAAGHISLKSFDLNHYLGKIDAINLPAGAFRKFGFSSDFQTKGSQVEITSLQLLIDQSMFSGWLTAKLHPLPAIEFSLQGNQLQLDKYITTGQSATDDYTQRNSPIFLPLLGLLRIEGNLDLESLKLEDLHLENLSLRLNNNPRLLTVLAFMQFAGGQVNAGLSHSHNGKTPIALQATLEDLEMKQLNRALQLRDWVQGRLHGEIQMQMSNPRRENYFFGLDGSAVFNLQAGYFRGYDLPNLLSLHRAGRLPSSPVDSNFSRITRFDQMQLVIEADAGKAIRTGLRVDAAPFSLNGMGEFDRDDLSFDHEIRLEPSRKSSLNEVVIPLQIKSILPHLNLTIH